MKQTYNSHKNIFALIFLFFFMRVLFFGSVDLIPKNKPLEVVSAPFSAETTAIFPSSLQILGEEAFEDTAFKNVVFGEQLKSIGQKAFYGSRELETIYIHPHTKSINCEAFPASVVIYGTIGSYAYRWARQNGYSFEVTDIWNPNISWNINAEQLILLICIYIIPFYEVKIIDSGMTFYSCIISMRPQDRCELYPIDYRFP